MIYTIDNEDFVCALEHQTAGNSSYLVEIHADSLMKQLFQRTFQHPILGCRCDLVSVDWLLGLANPNPTACTDLVNWRQDELVTMDELFRNLLAEGMRDPLLIGVGRVSRMIRLEAGNHRVRVFHARGIKYVPAIAYVSDSAITHEENGTHPGRYADLKLPISPNIMGPYPEAVFARPQDVIVDCPAVSFSGW
ncbi:MAG: hypothetical protein V4568_03615 [Pseudomonadota bacterium]